MIWLPGAGVPAPRASLMILALWRYRRAAGAPVPAAASPLKRSLVLSAAPV